MPPVYDQGQLGSCTANSIGAILEFNELKQAETDAATPSRLFIYYNERAMEGTVSQDSGAEIRDGIKSVAQLGAPPETAWPYVITRFARKPPAKAYKAARRSTRRSGTRGCVQSADGDPERARGGLSDLVRVHRLRVVRERRRLGRDRPDAAAGREHGRRPCRGRDRLQADPRPALFRVPQLLGRRTGATTGTSGCRRATSRATTSRATSGSSSRSSRRGMQWQ